MAYGRKDGSSYLDGVQVKVSEKFRAPRKIVLPFSLSRNSLPQSLNFDYDFSTELKAIEQAENYREEQIAKQKACVEKVASDIEQFSQSGAVCNGSLPTSEKVKQAGNLGSLMPAVPSNSILLPAPAAEAKEPASRKNDFNLAEFENDTSSPFDYMELQTINDMEELNSVFQGMTGAAVRECKEETRNPKQDPTRQEIEHVPPDVNATSAANGVATGSVEDTIPKGLAAGRLHILRTSDLQLFSDGGPHDSNAASQLQLPETPAIAETLHRRALRATLSPELEELLQSVIDMGFPEDRALRVIQRHGADSKKVIEHLCQIQSLTDEGFSEDDAEAALTEHQDSYKQALEFLKLQQQFLALGFPKERISSALHECNNDRDRALDSLLG
ncbi:ubiquitin-associated protein 1-like [Ornithodoros turicata]|uniref:ubiquitin-associated protein 1-like n=1 Tax=Ornithodoros turicata TaxID=34597 RepID=UPI00313A2501